jgi:hypothetical protein
MIFLNNLILRIINMSRFDLDLAGVSANRILLEKGAVVEGIISSGGIASGEEDKNGNPWLRLEFEITLTEDKVIKLLEQDAPKVFSQILIGVDKETHLLSSRNDRLGKFLEGFGLKEKEDEFKEGLDDIEDAFLYLKALMTNISKSIEGFPVLATIGLNEYEGNTNNTVTSLTYIN